MRSAERLEKRKILRKLEGGVLQCRLGRLPRVGVRESERVSESARERARARARGREREGERERQRQR